MKKFALFFAVLPGMLLCSGCNTIYNQKWKTVRTAVPAKQLQTSITHDIRSGYEKVPCAIEINCPDPMIGIDDALFYTDQYNYSLKNILLDTFGNVRDQLLLPPHYSSNVFQLIIDVQEAVLQVNPNVFGPQGSATFSIDLICRLYDPREKRIYATNIAIQKEATFNKNEKEYVFDSVYAACMDAALSAFSNILKDRKVRSSFSQFSDSDK